MQLKKELWKGNHAKLKLINPRKGNHYTGRRCHVEGCDGYLFDSTIDFGDNLPEPHINRGFELADQAELCIVLGSRCSVSPACDMPISVGKSGRPLLVVNLQKTAADNHSTLRIGSKIDDVMVPLMRMLGIPIPEFKLSKMVCLNRSDRQLRVRGLDADQTPNDLLWNVQIGYGCPGETKAANARIQFNQDALCNKKNLPQPGDCGTLTDWPWESEQGRAHVTLDKGGSWVVSPDICNICDGPQGAGILNAGTRSGPLLEHIAPDTMRDQCSSVTLMFRSHYREPPLSLPVPSDNSETLYRIVYNPLEGSWDQPEVLSHVGPAPVDPPQHQLEIRGSQDPVPQMKLLRMLAASPEQQLAVREVAATALQSAARRMIARNNQQQLYMDVKYQEGTNDSGGYRCYHQLKIEGDIEQVAAVNYNTPGQGFSADVHRRTEAPFEMKFGPCWGRPHVTVDVMLKDGTVMEQVWSENLPAANQKIQLGVETA